MGRRRRTYNYKFAEKSHSAKGIVGFFLALLSLISGIIMIIISFLSQGNGTVYLGSAGMLSMIAAFAAFILSVLSVRAENSYRVFPTVAVVLSVLVLGGWTAVYVLGFWG